MQILVTGGAGFIGNHLVQSLSDHDVTIFDNFSNSSISEISHLEKNNVKIIKGDITKLKSLESSLNYFDIVIHLAAQINVDVSVSNPDYNNKVNVIGTKNLLDFCVKKNIKNFITASSAAVFGESTDLPLTEKSPLVPISPYGESKVSMEKLVKEYAEKFDMNCIVLRFFNIYGLGQSDEYAGVISKFIKQIHKNDDLIIFGDGKQTRDFLSIHDLIVAINSATKNIKGKRGLCINIGSGKSISINELANLMISLSKKSLKIKYEPRKKGDINHSSTLITCAQNELNFIPKISLEDGIQTLLLEM